MNPVNLYYKLKWWSKAQKITLFIAVVCAIFAAYLIVKAILHTDSASTLPLKDLDALTLPSGASVTAKVSDPGKCSGGSPTGYNYEKRDVVVPGSADSAINAIKPAAESNGWTARSEDGTPMHAASPTALYFAKGGETERYLTIVASERETTTALRIVVTGDRLPSCKGDTATPG